MALDTSLVNTQQYKVRIKGKVEESRERSKALPFTSVYWKGSILVAFDYFYFTYMEYTNILLSRRNLLFVHLK